MKNKTEIALQEVEYLSALLSAAEKPSGSKAGSTIRNLQVLAGAGSAALLMGELLNGSETALLFAAVRSQSFGIAGITSIALLLFPGLLGASLALKAAADVENKSVDSIVGENLRYFSLGSMAADLLIKFALLSFVLLSGQPLLFSVSLFLFIADWLFQGKFFTFSKNFSPVLGTCCVAVGFMQWIAGDPSLMWPLAVFSAVSFGSVAASLSQQSMVER